ncbi:hypothetical protein HBA55_20355 [Pseudomaricurvus alkylphenolicus]|uniref:hypothetical protein n=1 Tax=Pseudomaricurvus alkylphenolicus TaxID=1306991 RepID=UPI00141EBB12|nr:hypothetical protein [Pseudomaricurvus alkylphenolicus]NIB41970.1 hypothetical protein [Pseudomaricurvus alkylphenolicus]
MRGLSTSQHHRVHEPTTTYSANNRYRQVARIIKHLRDEIHAIQPRLAKPTTAMIDHLVFNCPLHLLQQDDWQKVIIDVLEYMIEHLDPLNYQEDLFTRCDRPQPLFPNEELFDQQDSLIFAQALLLHQREAFE